MRLLQERANRGMTCPSNIEIARYIGMGKQRFQPWDRTQGVGRKPEAGAIIVAALVYCGLIRVEHIGRNRRRITILATGQVLEPTKPRMAA